MLRIVFREDIQQLSQLFKVKKGSTVASAVTSTLALWTVVALVCQLIIDEQYRVSQYRPDRLITCLLVLNNVKNYHFFKSVYLTPETCVWNVNWKDVDPFIVEIPLSWTTLDAYYLGSNLLACSSLKYPF